MWVFFFRGQLWTVAVGSAKGFSDVQKSLLESATSQSGSWNFSVVLGQRFQHSLEDQFTMYISHLQHWLSGGRWVSAIFAIFFGGCPLPPLPLATTTGGLLSRVYTAPSISGFTATLTGVYNQAWHQLSCVYNHCATDFSGAGSIGFQEALWSTGLNFRSLNDPRVTVG